MAAESDDQADSERRRDKAVVKGATIYRLRVAGLSKADAAALCARLKGEGGDCFIAK